MHAKERYEYEKTSQPTNWEHSNSMWKPRREGCSPGSALGWTGPSPVGPRVSPSHFDFLTNESHLLLLLSEKGQK